MNNFKRVSAVVLAGLALCAAPGRSYGLGFGHASSRAILGDTLKMSLPLRLEPGEEITNECLAADVYFGDDKIAPKFIYTEVLPGRDANERILRVTSTLAINEPVITVYLAAGCQSRVTRKIVAFPDPPMVAANAPLVEASPNEVSEAIQSATVPVVKPVSPHSVLSSAMPPASPSSSSRKLSRAERRAAQRSIASSSSSSRAPLPSMLMTDVASPADGQRASTQVASSSHDGAKNKGKDKRGHQAGQPGKPDAMEAGRLLLDPVDADATVIPELRMTASLGDADQAQAQTPDVQARRDAAAALWLALNASPEHMQQDRQRLQDLEQRLAQFKQEGDQLRQNVAGLQARVQQAESAAFGKWLYGATLLAFVGLGLSGFLFWRLRQAKQGADGWWQAPAPQSEPELGRESELGQTSVEFVHVPSAPQALATSPVRTFSTISPERSSPLSPLSTAQLHQLVPDAAPSSLQRQHVASHVASHHNEPLREVSVEELIDLEQQAEFFVVLGQDDAAIDLLEGHVQHTTGASPLPFLKLLEIYRRLGRRIDYERVQFEFNARFNAYAPAWEADLQQGHSLGEYPGVIERLQSLWSSPVQAMAVLEKSLTRPDSSEDTFELPAYRELLFLYAVARDLSEREVVDRHGVDLLLPVVDAAGEQPPEPVNPGPAIEPLMATRPVKAHPDFSPSISLDLQLDDLSTTQSDSLDHKP